MVRSHRTRGYMNKASLQLKLSVAAPGGHIRDNDVISGEQPFGNLDAIIRDPAEEHLHAAGLLTVGRKSEEGKRFTGVRLQGPLDEGGLRNLLDFDGAAGGKVGTSLVRLRAV